MAIAKFFQEGEEKMEDKKVYVLRGFFGTGLEEVASLIVTEVGTVINYREEAIRRAKVLIEESDNMVEALVHEIDASKEKGWGFDDLSEENAVELLLKEQMWDDRWHKIVYVGRELEKPGKGYVVVASNGRVLGLGWTEEEAFSDAWNNCEYEEEWTDSEDQRDTLNEDYAIDVMRASKDAMSLIYEGENRLRCTDKLITRATHRDEYDIYTKEEYIRALVNNEDGWASHWSY